MLPIIIILCLVGLLMVFAEIYVPGAILGTLGALCLMAAVGAAYYEYGFGVGSTMLVGVSILSLASVALGLKIFPNTPLGRQLQLQSAIDSPKDTPDFSSLLGRQGVAITSLRPSGAARIGDQRIDVVSQGGLIEKDTPVVVIQTEGARVVVRAIEPAEISAKSALTADAAT